MSYKIILALFVVCAFGVFGFTDNTVTLSRNGNVDTQTDKVNNVVADKALAIASLVLNSKEFQDSIIKLNFPYNNHCEGCKKGRNRKEKIGGQIVLDSILREGNPKLTLHILPYGKKPTKRKCFGLGRTCPDSYAITSYYENIDCSMGNELPFACSYAVHLCHEYSHNVGYCHTTNSVQTDIAEAIGEIAYYLVKQWYDTKDQRLIDLL